MRRFSVATVIASLAALCCFALVLASILGASNCGGNSAALYKVLRFALVVRESAQRRPDGTFSLASATEEERGDFASITDGSWTGSARYLVSTQPFRTSPGAPRRMLIVCDRAFSNVPRRLILANAPTHAVAFSDGSNALISKERFAALDLSSFTPLDQFLAETAANGQQPRE